MMTQREGGHGSTQPPEQRLSPPCHRVAAASAPDSVAAAGRTPQKGEGMGGSTMDAFVGAAPEPLERRRSSGAGLAASVSLLGAARKAVRSFLRGRPPLAGTEPNQWRCDSLTVFQASPLVYEDENKEIQPVEDALDFDREREVITESLSGAGIGAVDAVFKTGTTEELDEFLASGCRGGACQALHFSCHGGRDCLYFENKRGAAHPVAVKHLPDYIKAGGGGIRFAFVFACHSQEAGEAFLRAGASHVVCCGREEKLSDTSVPVFCKSFYTALAWGKTLQYAFERGRHAVKISHSEDEMSTFLLLPEFGTDHNVQVFRTDGEEGPCNPTCHSQEQRCSPWTLVHPPPVFIGREQEMYEVLCRLRTVQLVRLIGPSGVGKRSLAAAVCRYIKDRMKSFDVLEVMWLPLTSSRKDDLASSLRLLFETLLVAGAGDLGDPYRKARDVIIEALQKTKALIAIDAKGLNASKLSLFLNELCQKTKDVKVVLVCQDGPGSKPYTDVAESELKVGPLSFEHSATLFGKLCPLIAHCDKDLTPKKLSMLLSRAKFPERRKDAFRIIGNGIPAKVAVAANVIKEDQFDKLLKLCRIDCIMEFNRKHRRLSAIADEMEACIERHERDKRANGAPRTLPPLLVGVDFGPALMDKNREWAKSIVNSREIINAQIRDLLENAKEIAGEDKVRSPVQHEVEYIVDDKRERAVVTLKVDIELPGDLEQSDRRRIQRCCESIAKLLRHADVPEDMLEDIMLGKLWRGSVNIILDATRGVFNKLFSLALQADMKLPLGNDAYVVSIVPAFVIRAVSNSAGVHLRKLFLERFRRLEDRNNTLHVKQGGVFFLVPTSRVASSKLMAGVAFLKEKNEIEWLDLLSIHYGSSRAVPSSGPSKAHGRKGQYEVTTRDVATSSASASASATSIPDQQRVIRSWRSLRLLRKVKLSRRKQPVGGTRELVRTHKGTHEAHDKEKDKAKRKAIYSRLYKVSMAEERGTYQWADGTVYEGNLMCGMAEGRGKCRYANGAKFEGMWKGGVKEGHGKYQAANGDTYEGNWQNDEAGGAGTFRFVDGRVYQGEWKEGKMEGRGTFWWDGAVYDGGWKGGMAEGHGTYREADGREYEGRWKGGVKEGHGTFRHADGRVDVRRYNAGKCVGEGARWSRDRATAHRLMGGNLFDEIRLAEAAEIARLLGLTVPD